MTTPHYKTLSDSQVPIAIVQGKAVPVQPAYGSGMPESDFGERLVDSPDALVSNRGCRDCIWSVLFYAHLGAILYCTIAFVPQLVQDLAQAEAAQEGGRRLRTFRNSLVGRSLQQQQEGDDNYAEDYDFDPNVILIILGVAFAAALLASSAALGLLMVFAETVVKASLVCNIVLMTACGILLLVMGIIEWGVVFLFMAVIAAFFTCRVWHRVPFAASNLKTAVTAVRSNMGLAFYAYLSVATIFAWSIWWSISFLATIYVNSGCTGDEACEVEANGGVVFLFLLSYYWTIQVIGNVVHCTTAGTVGTWWLIPHEANGCCSKAVKESYLRSITTSFGSICFASLIVAIIQAIRELVHSLRENGDSFIACCAECLLACIESLVEIFNRFALIYVAIHGQSFLQAGRSVMDLFRARGWTTIITDALVDTVLFMICLAVALSVGLFSLVVSSAWAPDTEGILVLGFVLGACVGYACCSILFSVVGSAVNAVIVLFAENPNEFEINHPELSSQMRSTWRQAWPDEFSY